LIVKRKRFRQKLFGLKGGQISTWVISSFSRYLLFVRLDSII